MSRVLIWPLFAAWLVCLLVPADCFAQGFLAQFRVETTDLLGNPISTVERDQPFLLAGYVLDLRGDEDGGVFAAFMDVTFDPAIATATGPVDHGPIYTTADDGATTAGLLDEIGGVSNTIIPLGPTERLLFTVPFQAGHDIGATSFVMDPAELFPAHVTLLYGLNDSIPPDQILYGSANLAVVPEPTSVVLGMIAAITCALHYAQSRRRQRRAVELLP